MTTPQRSARRAVLPLLRLVLAVQAAQMLVAVISGIAASVHRASEAGDGFTPQLESGAQRLLDFAGAGDGEGVLLMLLATVLLWLAAMLPRAERPWRADFVATAALLVLTGISTLLTAIGYGWVAADADFFPASQEIRYVGSAVVYGAAMAAALWIVGGINTTVSTSAVVAEDDGEAEAAVFAVDRKSGDVLAWTSRSEARAKAPLYGVEDDEYEWFLDDGTVLQATADGPDVSFTATGEERPDDLVQALKDYAQRREFVIDDDEADEPLAYVDPIARHRYLDMWPGWLRWLGRLTR